MVHEHLLSNTELLHIDQPLLDRLVSTLVPAIQCEQESYYNLLMKGCAYNCLHSHGSPFKFVACSSPNSVVEDGVYNGYVNGSVAWGAGSVYVKGGHVDPEHELNVWTNSTFSDQQVFMVHIPHDVWCEMKDVCIMHNVPSPAHRDIMDAWRFLCKCDCEKVREWVAQMHWHAMTRMAASKDFHELTNGVIGHSLGEQVVCIISHAVNQIDVNGIRSSVRLSELKGYGLCDPANGKCIHSVMCTGSVSFVTSDSTTPVQLLTGKMVIRETGRPDTTVHVQCIYNGHLYILSQLKIQA